MRVFASFRRHGRKRIFGKQSEIGESGGRERRDVLFLGVFRGGVGIHRDSYVGFLCHFGLLVCQM